MKRWFMDLKISQKVIALVVIMLAFVVGEGVLCITNNLSSSAALNSMYEDRLLSIQNINKAMVDSQINVANMLQFVAAKDAAEEKVILADIKEKAANVLNLYTQFKEKGNLDSYEQQKLEKVMASLKEYKTIRKNIIDLATSGNRQGAQSYYRENKSVIANYISDVQDLVDYEQQLAKKIDAENDKASSNTLTFSILCVVVALTLSIPFSVFLVTMLHRRFANLLKQVKTVEGGDFTATSRIEAMDEIGTIGTALNNMASTLRKLMNDVNGSIAEVLQGSEDMHTAADQTSQGAQHVADSISQLAGGTQQIAKNINELATGIQQIAKSVSQLSDGSQKQAVHVNEGLSNIKNINGAISNISQSVTETAKASERVELAVSEGQNETINAVNKVNQVKQTAVGISQTINELGDLGANIEVILELIKTIAGQTNLLALNAAIEAARAGEHGKGFAVVADEVKKLATQSAEATDKITGIIKEIQNKTHTAVIIMDENVKEIEVSVESIDKVNNALVHIQGAAKVSSGQVKTITEEVVSLVKDSERVAHMMEEISYITEEIAASSEEISSITEQTSASAEEVSSITEESAASAEEISGVVQEQTASLEEINASSYSLAKIAEGLNKQIAVFKV